MNAADAFDIGNFDDDDTRGIKVAEEDQKLYRKFNLVVSDRWQAEMMGRYCKFRKVVQKFKLRLFLLACVLLAQMW